MSKIILPLEIVGKSNLSYDDRSIESIKEEIDSFLSTHKELSEIDLIKHVLLSLEIKFNNANEGYYDDIRLIEDVVENREDKSKVSYEKRRRIRNLYKGYNFILEGATITQDNLNKLYKLLSKNLLTEEEQQTMGKYYRTEEEFLFESNNMAKEPRKLLDPSYVERLMNMLFEYIYTASPTENIEKYIVSQIIHFYLVYVHPYYDVNGRTSRTLGIWYLLNEDAVEYTIFNRAITLDKLSYYKKIRYAEKFADLTAFLLYMLENIKTEFEKESVICSIEDSSGAQISDLDRQTIYSFLSNNSQSTLCDFSRFYARFNDREKIHQIYKNMIEPLLDKGIFIRGKNSQKIINGNMHNFFFGINSKLVDEEGISRLSLKQKLM